MLKKIIILLVLIIALAGVTYAFKGISIKKTPLDQIVTGNALIDDIPAPLTSTTTDRVYNLQGNYSTYEVIKYPFDYDPNRDPKPEIATCTAFTILSGDNEIISKYEEMVKRGNTINHIDENGRLVLNINLSDLSEVQKNLLVNSDLSVSLQVRDKEQVGKDGYYCQSFVDLISVTK